jgi:HEAT repeat protein
MAKAPSVDDAIARLVALRGKPATPEAREMLSKGLASKSNLVVAKAAAVAQELRLTDLGDEMIAAFERLMAGGTPADKGCFGKTALAVALDALDRSAEAIFLAGIHHVQPEGVWGGSADTAAGLRAACAVALVRCNYRYVMLELADLLVDPESPARVGAARAMALSQRDDATVPALRVKLLAGDEEPAVAAECLAALLALSPRKSLAFAAKFLDSIDPSIQDAAAVAIGSTRLPEALEILQLRAVSERDQEMRRSLMLGIAMTRLPGAVECLISTIRDGNVERAMQAVEAMRIYRYDEAVTNRIAEIVEARGEERVGEMFRRTFLGK